MMYRPEDYPLHTVPLEAQVIFMGYLGLSFTSVPFMDAFVYIRDSNAQGYCSKAFILSKALFLQIPVTLPESVL